MNPTPHELSSAGPAGTPNAWSTGLRWLARLLFAAALASAAYGVWLGRQRRAQPVVEPGRREKPVSIDWSREPFQTWTSVEDGVEVQYPARYDAVRAFGRFTSRDLKGGLEETDVVVFRSAEPRSVIVVATYRASRPLSWEEWVALAKQDPGPVTPEPKERPLFSGQAPAAFSMEFGGTDREYREARLGDRQALAVSAKGAVKYPARGNEQMEVWRFESHLVAEGDRAARITAGVHVDQYAGALPGLEKTLNSFRWNPPPER